MEEKLQSLMSSRSSAGGQVVSLTGLAAHGKAASNGTLGPSASLRMRTLLGEIESFMATISPIANA